MTKNIKSIFFVLTLITLLVTVGAVSAADDANSTTTVDSSVSDVASVSDSVSDTVAAAPATTSDDNKVDTKTIEKEEKNLKTSAKIVDVNNYNELETAIRTAINDNSIDDYIINMNDGTYQSSAKTTFNKGNTSKNIIINANNQAIWSSMSNSSSNFGLIFNSSNNVTINNAIFYQSIDCYMDNLTLNNVMLSQGMENRKGNVTLKNMTFNTSIICNGEAYLTICDDVVFGEDAQLSNNGVGGFIVNDANRITPYITIYRARDFSGVYLLENATTKYVKTNEANLTIRNTTLNAQLTNSGNLTICDDVTFGDYFLFKQRKGNLTINDTSRLIPYLSEYNGNYTIENMNILTNRINNGNLTIKNSTISFLYYSMDNNGNLTLTNTLIDCKINNEGVLVIDDNCSFGDNFILVGDGELVINDTDRLIPFYSTYNGTYTLEDRNIATDKINYGNLTLINTIVNASITNYGNLTLINSTTLDSGILTNNMNMTIVNSTINDSITNNAQSNLLITNSSLNDYLTNNGYLELINNSVNGTIRLNNKNSILSIDDKTTFTPESVLKNDNGQITIDDIGRILPILYRYSANITYVIENAQIINNKDNRGNITFKNSTLNTSISNSNIIIINDDCIYGENFIISGSGELIVNDTDKILQHLNTFNGNYTINTTLDRTASRTNYGNLTIINTTINYQVSNSNGNLTIINTTIDNTISNRGNLNISNATINAKLTNSQGDSNITDSTINEAISHNNGLLTFRNSTLNGPITANDDIMITDDCTYGDNLRITGRGEVIVDDMEKIIPYLDSYHGEVTIENATVDTTKTNYGTLTYKNSTLNATISNQGTLIISDDTTFGEKFKITGNGQIIINDTNRIGPYIATYNGVFTLENITISESKTNNGNLTLNNCTITATITNKGNLTLNNCTINMSGYYLSNTGTTYIREDTVIINGISRGNGKIINTTLPKPQTYIVTNETLHEYFHDDAEGKLMDIVNPRDILDFQGIITANHSLTVNKPINIISSTQDAYVDLDTHGGSLQGEYQGTTFTVNNDGSYSNITGIYFHNTQLWFYNTHHVTINNISAVVEDQTIGGGVGQTSIRANSTYITVKNSYFYTRNNGGSSTLVLAWADYCTIENCTIEGGGNNGNLLYLTTYNVEVPEGTIANSNNRLINNTVRGESSAIAWAIVLSGVNNTVDGNTVYADGAGIMQQWADDPSLGAMEYTIRNITVQNNKIYGGGSINAGDYIYNNYVESGYIAANNSILINNTAKTINLREGTVHLINNTVNTMNINNALISYANITGNTIDNININRYATNLSITNNTINNININGSYCNITNNTIITDNEYTITGRGKDNIITDNYLVAKTLIGDNSIQLNKNTNTITNNKPYETTLQIDTTTFTIGQTANITASIYYGNDILTNISKGKVTFKVNGKTLKDENGKVIYAKIVNGTATIENYQVPTEWAKEGTTIQAVYSGSIECEKLTSEKTEITITKEEPTLTTESITATAGTTIQLKATITDGDKVINSGKVVFKINGKTVKDTNGKVIYAKIVNNQVIVNYTLLADMKAKEYNITATFISSDYERLEDTKTLTVTA